MTQKVLWQRRAIGFISVVVFISIWDHCSATGVLDADLFPSFVGILKRCLILLTNREFLTGDVAASLARFAIASVITVPLAVLLALTSALVPWFWSVVSPFFNFTLPLPKVAIFPLILAQFGIGDTGKITLIGIGMFYPLFLNVFRGATRLKSAEWTDLIAIYRIRGIKLWYRYYLRGLRIDLVTGLKTSFGYGFTLVIVSELTASRNGIGNFIWRSWDAYNIVDMYAGVIILCFIGWLMQAALDRLSP